MRSLRKLLTLSLALPLAGLLNAPTPAGAAALDISQVTSEFNAFVFGNMTANASDTEGCVAVGGNASFSAYSIGVNATASCLAKAAPLVVGGNVTFTNGSVSGAAPGQTAIFFGGTLSTSSFGINGGGVATKNGNVIDFAGTQSNLDAQSLTYAALASNGTTSLNGGTLTLTGANTLLNVFSVTAAQLAAASSVNIVTPSGAIVIVNVSGSSDSLQNAGFSGNLDSTDVLYNFYQATGLTLSGIGLDASVLAPLANVSFFNGHINGTLIADAFASPPNGEPSGQLNEAPWNAPDPVPEPGSASILGLALLAASAVGRRAMRDGSRSAAIRR